jgi:hypothetical protein
VVKFKGVIFMKKRNHATRLDRLRKTGEVVHHKRDAKVAKDGRIRTFRLARGIKLEKAVKGER